MWTATKRDGAGVQALLLALATLAAYLPGLGRQEFVGTEDFRGRIASEMLERGDFVEPTFYGRPIYTKPPLQYFFLAGSYTLTGERGPWASRLVSLAALSAMVVGLGLAARATAGPRAGYVAGLGYLMGVNTLKNGVNAEIDPLFAALTVIAVLCWWRGLPAAATRDWPGRKAATGWLLAAGALAGLAAMAKGPAVLPFLIAMLAAGRIAGRPLPARGALAALLVFLTFALAWPAAIWLREASGPAAVTEGSDLLTAWTPKMIRRTFTYPLALFGAALPFSLPALFRLRNPARPALDRYLVWTALLAFAVLLLPAGKSTRYLLPCFPLLCLAGALRLELLARTGDFVRALGMVFGLAAVVVAAIVAPRLPAAGWAALTGLLGAGVVAWRIGASRPAVSLLLLAILSRACFTQVYVPLWEASGNSIRAAVTSLQELMGGVERLAIVRLQTPRLTDPLASQIEYFPEPADLAAALAQGSRFDAVLLSRYFPSDVPPGFVESGSLAALGKDLRVYRPE